VKPTGAPAAACSLSEQKAAAEAGSQHQKPGKTAVAKQPNKGATAGMVNSWHDNRTGSMGADGGITPGVKWSRDKYQSPTKNSPVKDYKRSKHGSSPNHGLNRSQSAIFNRGNGYNNNNNGTGRRLYNAVPKFDKNSSSSAESAPAKTSPGKFKSNFDFYYTSEDLPERRVSNVQQHTDLKGPARRLYQSTPNFVVNSDAKSQTQPTSTTTPISSNKSVYVLNIENDSDNNTINNNKAYHHSTTTTAAQQQHEEPLRSVSQDRKIIPATAPLRLEEFFSEMREIKEYNDSVPDTFFLG